MNVGTIELPAGFDPPKQVRKDGYWLEVLGPEHNVMDYEAWTSSRDELKGIFGPKNHWPAEVTSIEQNLADLERHYREFMAREAFAYTLLSPDKSSCIGCLYIRPTPAKGYDARVDFWFRKTSMHLEQQFYREIDSWLKRDWGFREIAYPGRNISWEEYLLVTDGLA